MARLVLPLVVLLAASVQAAQPWPEIPEAERVANQVAFAPHAAAVVLFESSETLIKENLVSSSMLVYRRLKVLRAEGVEHATVRVPWSKWYRLADLEGRTHTPDGRVVPLDGGAVFVAEQGGHSKRRLTSFALPEVTAGAIIEYRFRLYFDSIPFPITWAFQSELPTLRSEAAFVLPSTMKVLPAVVKTLPALEIERGERHEPRGMVLTYAMSDLPPLPDEPFRYPDGDLTCRVTLVPQVLYEPVRRSLFDDWDGIVDLLTSGRTWGYRAFARNGKTAQRTAKERAMGLTGRAAAERIYRFVRDEVVTDPVWGVMVDIRTADGVLADGRADPAEKALLLRHMLDAVGIDAGLVWAGPANELHANPKLPDPGQFDRVLVTLELDGEILMLDPSGSRTPFGAVEPELEGVKALDISGKKPQWITTPESPATVSQAETSYELSLDDQGNVSGRGTLTLTGHRVEQALALAETAEGRVQAWREKLNEGSAGLAADDVEVAEEPEDRRVVVAWRVASTGSLDELTLGLGGPWSLGENPFVLAPERRYTPVHLPFAFTDRLELDLQWTGAWTLEQGARMYAVANGAGSASGEVVPDPDGSGLRVAREFRLDRRDSPGPQDYAELRSLYEVGVANEREELVLTRVASGP